MKAAKRLLKADAKAANAMARVGESGWLDRAAGLADQPQLRMLCAATIAAGLVAGRDSRNAPLARAGVRMLIAHELATLAKNWVKLRVDRKRPRSRANGHDHKPKPGRHTRKEVTSFPSGHAAGAAAVSSALAREMPALRTPAYAAAGVLALLQLPRSAHYPSDTAAGFAIGLAAEAVLARLWPVAAPPARQGGTGREVPPCAAC